MKTFLSFCIAACSIFCSKSVFAQVPAIYCIPAVPCAGPTATAQVGLASAVPSAVSYSWSATGNCTLSPAVPNNSIMTAMFGPGVYTITMFPFAMSGTTSVLLNAAIVATTINVGSGPTTTIVSTSNNLCLMQSATLTAFGATTYTWSNSAVGQSIVITPTASACYSVAGQNPGSCYAINSICINVLPLPQLNVVPGTTNVCEGSSETFTAYGASTYTWNNSVTTPTYNILPTASGMHTLVGTSSVGCTWTYTFGIFVDSTCANVWPGDANSDGVVGLSDVLEIGLQASSTGTVRTPGGNAYTSQYATAWTGSVSTGKNKCHADCNGDGTVNINDTIAIYNNFSLTHAFRPSPAAANDQITLVPIQTQAQIGRWNEINVVLGSSANQVQAHGVAFEINYDNSKIVPDSIWIEFVNSPFTAGNQFIPFRKKVFANGKLYVALTRAGGPNASVGGVIAKLHYKVSAQVAAGSTLNFGVSAAEKQLANGLSAAVDGDTQTLSATNNLTSISKENTLSAIAVYPNPAKDIVVIRGTEAALYSIKVLDLSGRILVDSKFTSQTNVNVAALENGIYLIEVADSNGVQSQRITVMH